MDRIPTLRIGERFGRFEITDVLPAGGMGEVYRAKDPMLRRDVAIKLLLRSEPHDLDRFKREAQTAAGFSHPNIVSVFEFGTEQRGDDSVPYLVMEFIEGASLRARMGAGKEQLLRWLTDVARGLAALHQRGVVHRDLKPENIMIGKDDRARIVDFGLAKADGTTITTTGTIVGTVDYFSPEQAAGRRLDYRTDLFSFGIVLYEACTGTHPFRAATVPETIRRIHYESPSRVPGRLGEIIARCLKKNPLDRYLDAADIARDLEEVTTPVLTTKGVIPSRTADSDVPTVKMPRTRAMARWWLITLTAVLLLAATVALYRQKLRSDATPPPQAVTTRVATPQATPLPSCGLTGSPGKINYGASARLRWSSSNVTDVVISPDIGIVGQNGSIDVSPRSTTTYEILATSADGVVARGAVTIEVANAPPRAKYVPVAGSIGVTPDTIGRRGRTLLQWNSFGATRVMITPSLGILPLQGSISVAPHRTTTYTMTMSNDADGYGWGTATVNVLDGDIQQDLSSREVAVTCVAATQPGVTAADVTDSTSCSVPHQRVIRATLQYTLDEAGEIAVNGRNVFIKAPGSGPRDGTVNLPVNIFAPGKNFLLRVTARKAMSQDGTLTGKVFGKATVHLATTESLPGVDIGVSPPVLSKGGSAYLSWSSVNATAVTINPVIGQVAPKGTMRVALTETTTYTITGISASGEPARASIVLKVQ